MEFIDGSESQNGMVFGPTATVAPHRLYPFPYGEYYLNRQDIIFDFGNTYYNNPSYDATKLKITLGGDNDAWSDSGSYYNFGLLTPAEAIDLITNYQASSAVYHNDPLNDPQYTLLDGWTYLGAFTVDNPVQKLRYSIAGQNDLGPGAQTFYLPGVASLTGYYYSYYNAVICKGRPIWFELEFQQNEYKSNPNLYYSGYTNFGDFNSYECGQLYTHTSGGYVKRYVAGIIKKDANLATCTVDDIILGAIWTAEDLGGGVYNGVGHVVLNGVIRASCSTSSKPESVFLIMDPITQQTSGDLDNYTQYWTYMELDVENASFSNITYAYAESYVYPNGIASDAVDVYDIKYAWYMDVEADSGPGTAVGEIGFYMPMMYTHPGWYEE